MKKLSMITLAALAISGFACAKIHEIDLTGAGNPWDYTGARAFKQRILSSYNHTLSKATYDDLTDVLSLFAGSEKPFAVIRKPKMVVQGMRPGEVAELIGTYKGLGIVSLYWAPDVTIETV